MSSWNEFTERYVSGSRISPAVTLTTQAVIAESSSINWNVLTPTGTTLTIEIALSTDGGTTWGAWQTCTNGQSVPGISNLSSLQNVQLKIRETLTTTNVHATPELLDLTISIITAWDNIVYGPNKSTLTAWDSISLAWSTARLSLVINEAEACYIENPGLPTAFGSYAYIGTDRNSANAINTLVDELRLDKVYKDVATRTAWHKAKSPFYTSEDMVQLPGYVRVESDGIKVYDADNNLRVLIGSWLKDMIRKYGEKIIGGEFYSSFIQTGEEGETRGIIKIDREFLPQYPAFSWGNLTFNDSNGNLMMEMTTAADNPIMLFYIDGVEAGRLQMNAVTSTKEILLRSQSGMALLSGTANETIRMGASGGQTSQRGIRINGGSGQVTITSPSVTVVENDLYATGVVSSSQGKSAIEPTEHYGIRYLYCVEAPELLYVDRGRAQLKNGECTVYLDPIFLECIEPDTDLTPWLFKTEVYGLGESIRVIEWGENHFKVKEENDGKSNRLFGWWFEATRKNYAGMRLQERVII